MEMLEMVGDALEVTVAVTDDKDVVWTDVAVVVIAVVACVAELTVLDAATEVTAVEVATKVDVTAEETVVPWAVDGK